MPSTLGTFYRLIDMALREGAADVTRGVWLATMTRAEFELEQSRSALSTLMVFPAEAGDLALSRLADAEPLWRASALGRMSLALMTHPGSGPVEPLSVGDLLLDTRVAGLELADGCPVVYLGDDSCCRRVVALSFASEAVIVITLGDVTRQP